MHRRNIPIETTWGGCTPYVPLYQGPRLYSIHTDAQTSLHTLLVKYYNDLLGRQSSEQDRDEVTYFIVGDLFYIDLGTKYANFEEKIFAEISGKNFETFHCSNITTMKSLIIFSSNLSDDFFLKLGILSAKVYTKNVPNIQVCNFIPVTV